MEKEANIAAIEGQLPCKRMKTEEMAITQDKPSNDGIKEADDLIDKMLGKGDTIGEMYNNDANADIDADIEEAVVGAGGALGISEEQKAMEVMADLAKIKHSLAGQIHLVNHIFTTTPNTHYYKISNNTLIMFRSYHVSDLYVEDIANATDLTDLIKKDYKQLMEEV
jgi:hypothetical protein